MKVGDEVICIKQDQWRGMLTGWFSDGPKYKEELIIADINEEGALCFAEYPLSSRRGYMPRWFRKIEPAKEEFATSEIAEEGIEYFEIERECEPSKITAPQKQEA